jgi:serine/threonine-protein kinase RsbW
MAAARQAPEQAASPPAESLLPESLLPESKASGLRWRELFPGEERQLSAVRRWVEAFLPQCPARDDVTCVATELGTNAVRHTASGRGGWFAVEISWHQQCVRVAVTDSGAPDGPRMIDDPLAVHGRGLRIVQGLSARTGVCGDHQGRLVWADIPWPCTDVPRPPGGHRHRPTVPVPLDTEQQARELANVRAVYAATQADPGNSVMAGRGYELLTQACSDARAELGAFDRAVVSWLSGLKPEAVAAIAGIIQRAGAPGPGSQTQHLQALETRSSSAAPALPPRAPTAPLRPAASATITTATPG